MSSNAAPTSTSASESASGTDTPQCTACGACCFSELPEYVRVFGCDLDRMDEAAQSFVVFLGNRCFMRIEGGRCAALRIEVPDEVRSRGFDPIARTFTCAIYEMRPDVCRSLDRGSSGCRAERHAKVDRTLIAVERLLQGGRDDRPRQR